MENQIIIAVSREYASAGHDIAEMVAKHFELPFYDRNLLDEMFGHKPGYDKENIKKFDEAPSRFFRRTVRGISSSPEENIAVMQFEYMKKMAEEGKSFVIVGRCAETVLADYDCMIPIFVLGDYEVKLKRIMDILGLSEEEALAKMRRHDKNRKSYHNSFSDHKWGDSRYYDLCINSSRLGLEGTADYLESFIRSAAEKKGIQIG